ncbi:sodium/hydrogen exchanger family protein [Sarocladium implicatum]|nr:sodium/hydrogen exchanger family protein [Sarocladium implicatum]
MAWSQLDITKPHLVYIILGGFTSLFMLCSSFIKERMYIGEATVATLCGVIFGPHVADLIDPKSWGSLDIVTIEFSRIVLVVQCFAVGVELPKYYMEKHWKSVVYLLIPVMTFGWLIVSVFVWQLIPDFDWLDGLVVAACITATDPVLASSVVGKGKFAKRIPKHLRDLLSAESGCNDGMAFPFVYLSLFLIQYHRDAREISFHFVVYVILYECIFGAIFGFCIGYIARHGIKYAEKKELIDRESFLVFYFVVALFCAGAGSIIGVDDLLVGFAAGVGFSNDGWFLEKTEESHVSNVIDLLINLAYFVFLGTIVPWEQYNSGIEGLEVWRLVVIAVLVVFFRRIPIMLALKPLIPDVRTWREALFAGHFGPIGVGAIFVALLARAELEHGEPVPLSDLPPENSPYYHLIYLVWPIVTFMVITSIIVHGSSIAVFTLGKRINTLSLTMSYTAAPEDGPTWMNRLPRISSQSRSQARTMSETSLDDPKDGEYPSGMLAPPSGFLRRRKEGDGHSRNGSRASSLMGRRRKGKKWEDGAGAGGPIAQSAIFPDRQDSQVEKDVYAVPDENTESSSDNGPKVTADQEKAALEDVEPEELPHRPRSPPHISIYEEGNELVFEDQDGEVLDVQESGRSPGQEGELPKPATAVTKGEGLSPHPWSLGGLRRQVSEVYTREMQKRKAHSSAHEKRGPARAYQFGNTIIVEDEDGEVVKTYELPTQKPEGQESKLLSSGLKYIGLGGRRASATGAVPGAEGGEQAGSDQGQGAQGKADGSEADGDDKKIRFTINGVGARLTKEEFIKKMQNTDEETRREVVDQSTASQAVKTLAKQDPPPPGKTKAVPIPNPRHDSDSSTPSSVSSLGSARRKTSPRRSPVARGKQRSSDEDESSDETAVERKRRLAVLDTHVDDDEGQTGETPAERRRRQAALGLGSPGVGEDSEDEGTERVPPAARRGIRFAPEQERGRR